MDKGVTISKLRDFFPDGVGNYNNIVISLALHALTVCYSTGGSGVGKVFTR